MTKHPMPGAWYDLASRIESARNVAMYIHEAMPIGLDRYQKERADCVFSLTNAVIDLLELCGKDVANLENQLKRIDSANNPS